MPAKPEKELSEIAADYRDATFPDIDSNALLQLTRNIEVKLKAPTPAKSSKTPLSKSAKKGNEELQDCSHYLFAHGKKQATNKSRVNLRLSSPVQKQRSKTKRLRDGQLKDSSNSQTKASSIDPSVQEGQKKSNTQSEIEKEVMALGGTNEDFKLIDGLISDSEVEGGPTDTSTISRKDLEHDLRQIVKKFGTDGVKLKHRGNAPDTQENTVSFTPIQEAKRESLAAQSASGRKWANLPPKTSSTKDVPHLKIEPRSEWHSIALSLIPLNSQTPSTINRNLPDQVHDYAKRLLEHENHQYASHYKSSSSAHHFYSTIMSSGTLSDKISALTLSVQESPIHNLRALESLVGLAKKRSRGQAVEVLGALKDLLGPGGLLPSDRKLRTFSNQPELYAAFSANENWHLGDPLPMSLTDAHLILWAYEGWLKALYFEILQILESWCNDEIVFARGKAVDYVYQLLKEKPEQESNLLRLLVNKLGDSDKKIASRTSHNLLQLESSHPLMKPTVVAAIESDLLFRPGQSLHAQYYALITLNQTVLSAKEEIVAKSLFNIYFDSFIMLMEQPKASKPSIPNSNTLVLNKKGEVQGGGGAAGKKSQKKLAAINKGTRPDKDLREKMISAVLTGVNRALPFISRDDDAFENHMNTLFRVTHSSNFNTSVQALMLIHQLLSSHQGSNDRFYRTLYESLLDPRLYHSSKQALYLNLLFKALKSDLRINRVKAFSKRLLQVINMHQPPFVCGALYLLRELESVFASLSTFVDDPQVIDSDEEEIFQDVHEDTDVAQSLHAEAKERHDDLKLERSRVCHAYDGRKRDPQHSNADKSSLWELTLCLKHFHPTVTLFASKLMHHETLPAKPDLSLHTLIHFLDRFVYKNPKSSRGTRGASIMQPMNCGNHSSLLLSAHARTQSSESVNSEAFWKQESEMVEADEIFFHKYFSTMGRGKEKARKKKANRLSGVDSGSEEDEDEDEIWKALVDSRPELEGSSSSDDDRAMNQMDLLEDSDDNIRDLQNEDNKVANANQDMIELEDGDEALLASDEEVPSDLDQAIDPKFHDVGEDAAAASEKGKRKKKRRKLRTLPVFASADDYAAILNYDG